MGVGRIEWNGTAEIVPGGAAVCTYSYSNTVDDNSGNLLDGVFIQCVKTILNLVFILAVLD